MLPRFPLLPGGRLSPLVTTAGGWALGFLGSKAGVADAVFHVDPAAAFNPGSAAALIMFAGLGTYAWRDAAARGQVDDERDARMARIASTTEQVADRQAAEPSVEVVAGHYDVNRTVNRVQRTLLRLAPGAASAEQIDESIRTALQAVLSMLQRYDVHTRGLNGGHGIEYTANLAIFRRGADLTDAQTADLSRRMLFQGGELDPRRMPGVLDLRQAWSVTSVLSDAAGDAAGIDTKVDPLVLQIPHDYSPGNKYLALPGAPTAWCLGDVDIVHDVFGIPKRMEEDQSGTKLQADKIRDYFNTRAAHIQSFVSIALEPASDGSRDRLGVLNINCSKSGMLEDKQNTERIIPLLKSLCVPLSGAVEAALALTEPREAVSGISGTAARVTPGTAGLSSARNASRLPRGERPPAIKKSAQQRKRPND